MIILQLITLMLMTFMNLDRLQIYMQQINMYMNYDVQNKL